MFDDLLTALTFLTVLPFRTRREPHPGDLGRASSWFPLAGLLIGLVLAAGWWLFSRLFQTLPAAILTIALWAVLTGGLHLDGLADCCDGFFSARPVDRRLDIMRDPHLGTFGTAGLILFLLMKTALLSGLPASAVLPALLLAPAAARFCLLPAGWMNPARAEGLGFDFKTGLNRVGMAVSGLLILICLGAAGWRFLAAGMCAGLAAGGVLLLAKVRIGGVTGDVFGMLVETAELAFLLFLNLRFI